MYKRLNFYFSYHPNFCNSVREIPLHIPSFNRFPFVHLQLMKKGLLLA